MDKILIFGLGSIGSRHMRNLMMLRLNAEIHCFDPAASKMIDAVRFGVPTGVNVYDSWTTLIEWNPNADAAIIASPTVCHLEQAMALRDMGIPFYIEKPIGTLDQVAQFVRLNVDRCAVGCQYRFHPVYQDAAPAIWRSKHVYFAANDSLLDRYGPDCLSVIAAHPIDTALWLLGMARGVDMITDGRSVVGTIRHDRGESMHGYRIDVGPRVSIVSSGDTMWYLDANNQMYLDALSAWLSWVEGGERDPRTATLQDGIAALEVMSKVRRI